MYRYYVKDYVAHHGIIGMKWGDRNGPPYPLGSSEHASVTKSASPEAKAEARARGGGVIESNNTANAKPQNKRKMSFFQRQRAKKNLKKAREAAAQKRISDKEKERLVNEGSAEDIYKRRNELSEDQKRRAITRLLLDQQLTQLSENERRNKKTKVEKLMNAVEKTSKAIGTTVTLANNVKNFAALFDDSAETEKEAAKEKKKAIQSGDVKKISKYMGDMSNSDYNEVFNIMKSQKTLNDLNTGKKTVDDLIKADSKKGKGFNVDNLSDSDIEKLKDLLS